VRWQAQEQAAASLTMQAMSMSRGKKAKAQETQSAPKRKQPILSMDEFIKSQEPT